MKKKELTRELLYSLLDRSRESISAVLLDDHSDSKVRLTAIFLWQLVQEEIESIGSDYDSEYIQLYIGLKNQLDNFHYCNRILK